jgi:hypothetical protein
MLYLHGLPSAIRGEPPSADVATSHPPVCLGMEAPLQLREVQILVPSARM